jgi:site-specific DNA recombinase
MRAVLYLRLSSSDDASTSIVRQERDLRELADREGWEVLRVLVDDGISGRKTRANATEALRMLRDSEAEVLAVWKLDRWSRQGLAAVGDLVGTLDEVPGSIFVALRDGLRSDQPAWRITASVISEVARMEAENTAARVKSSVSHLRDTGRFAGGTVPFGFRTAPRAAGGRTLVPDPYEASIVRDVAEKILSGESQASIVDSLTAAGVPTTRSAYRVATLAGREPVDEETGSDLDRGSWSYAGLAAVWTGDSLLGRISKSKPSAVPVRSALRRWETVRGEDGQPLQAFEPILDVATVERLRAHLRDPKNPTSRRGPRRERRARLLSGVIYCAECDHRLWVSMRGGQLAYACSKRAGRCPGPGMKIENADRAVSEAFLAMIGDNPEFEEVEEITSPDTVSALADVEAGIRQATAALALDGADETALLRELRGLKERRTELQTLPSALTVKLVPTGRTIAEAWEASNDDQKRRLLEHALDHVALASTATKGHTGYHPERLTYHWRS